MMSNNPDKRHERERERERELSSLPFVLPFIPVYLHALQDENEIESDPAKTRRPMQMSLKCWNAIRFRAQNS